MFGTTAVQHAVPKELTSHTHMDDINFTMQFEQEEEEEEEELHQGLLGESGCIVAQLKIHARLQCLQLLGNCRSTVNMLPNASQHANISPTLSFHILRESLLGSTYWLPTMIGLSLPQWALMLTLSVSLRLWVPGWVEHHHNSED